VYAKTLASGLAKRLITIRDERGNYFSPRYRRHFTRGLHNQ
jgi:hypothetical protein